MSCMPNEYLRRARRTRPQIRFRACVLSVAALPTLIVATAASAQTQPESPAKARWILKAEDTSCKLIRSQGFDGAPAFEIGGRPGNDTSTMLLASAVWKKDLVRSETPAEIVIVPSGERVSATAYPLSIANVKGNGLALYAINKSFAQSFPSAAGFTVEAKGKRLAQVAFGGADRAYKMFKECEDDLLKAWGLDPVAHAALLKRPEPAGTGNIAQWFSDKDYPSEASNRGVSGESVVRIKVKLDGRVGECVIAVSSGDKSLDQASCAVILKRGRFVPAIDRDGKAVVADAVTSVRWMMPTG